MAKRTIDTKSQPAFGVSEVEFLSVALEVRTWKPANGAPGNGEKLTLYANYKQAREGDCGATPRPGMFDPTGRAKWDAWAGLKGKTVEQARADYVAEVKRQKAVYGTA